MTKTNQGSLSPTQQPRFVDAEIGDAVLIRRGGRAYVEAVIQALPSAGNATVTLTDGVQITIPVEELEVLMFGD